MKIENLKIRSVHNTLSEAVEASGIDLSYNESEARRTIRTTERNSSKAFVMENGDIYYLFHCDIKLLNKFEPFVSSITNSPFQVATIKDDEIMITHQNWPKTSKVRKHAKNYELVLTSY